MGDCTSIMRSGIDQANEDSSAWNASSGKSFSVAHCTFSEEVVDEGAGGCDEPYPIFGKANSICECALESLGESEQSEDGLTVPLEKLFKSSRFGIDMVMRWDSTDCEGTVIGDDLRRPEDSAALAVLSRLRFVVLGKRWIFCW